MPRKRLTCTVSGSFQKSLTGIRRKIADLERNGICVLSPGQLRVRGEANGFVFLEKDPHDAREVELRHLSAIASSDFLYVYNPRGYIGPSAAMEIGYALSKGVPVFCFRPPAEFTFSLLVETAPRIEEIENRLRATAPETRRVSFAELQNAVRAMTVKRGLDDESPRDIALLLMEESGEVAKAVRVLSGLKVDLASRNPPSLAEEIADCMIYLMHLANVTGVDAQAGLLAKLSRDLSRSWGHRRT